MLRTEAIKKFLNVQPYYMAHLYEPSMEVQVNVAQDNGEPIQGSYAGKKWFGYTDGLQTWKHIRVPWNASTNPTYIDKPIGFNITQHAEAIGMTGWDWQHKQSKWVGFDFDSILTHKTGLTQAELIEIQDTLVKLDFIYIFSSTSGNGLHIYTFINDNTEIKNHDEHAAVARAILSKVSGLTGISFEARVDILGGNLWVWHRKAIPDKSYRLIKKGSKIQIPLNWKNYIDNIRTKDKTVADLEKHTEEDELIYSKSYINLHTDHIKLLTWFENSTALWWWDHKKQMLVCHTADLKKAHMDLGFKGYFNTISTGKDHGKDQNCFCFPLEDGSWIIRRHTKKVLEHNSWFIDDSGWTTTYFNRLPSLIIAHKFYNGIEAEKSYNFKTLKDAVNTLLAMNISCTIPPGCELRPAQLQQLVDNRIRLSFEYSEYDSFEGWTTDKKKKNWEKYFYHPNIIDENQLPDKLIRHVVVNNQELGWFINTNNDWVQENKSNITSVLLSKGYKRNEVDVILGQCILKNWIMVTKPLQPEYPGNREWNIKAPQFRINPVEGTHKHWDIVLEHIGQSLNPILITNEWAKEYGIINGLLFLQLWIASLIQYPQEPLPYLFLFGDQNTGKSILHEALSLLFTCGYCRADQALTNPSGFNGELMNTILCIIEETNLSKHGYANDRIKDWVTARNINIHIKGRTPFTIQNHTHWIQCANDPDYCPTFPGDTRIVTLKIEQLKNEIPKPTLLFYLEQEAPAFLYTVLNFTIPESKGRLKIPVINTEAKLEQMSFNRTALQQFIDENIYKIDGEVIKLSEFFDSFQRWLEPIDRLGWTVRKVAKELSFPKGRHGAGGHIYIGNVSFTNDSQPKKKLQSFEGKLI